MDDPGKMLEQGVADTAQIMALQTSVKEGQRLLREAIRQRNALQSEVFYLHNTLRWLSECWAFKLLPKTLKTSIRVRLERTGD